MKNNEYLDEIAQGRPEYQPSNVWHMVVPLAIAQSELLKKDFIIGRLKLLLEDSLKPDIDIARHHDDVNEALSE